LDEGAALFGGADPMVMQAVISGTHARMAPAQGPEAKLISGARSNN
jgi:hypothetical protein